ncbi:MAG: hypothetical protein K0Q83_3842 [Deltaproteobacteria bacterium]|jgi:hypothetical protein|nr:hypothetical protein [Deltaproteobacteria bacterium]
MLVAGIQVEFGLDPRLKHSGVTILGSRISSPQPQFSNERAKYTKDNGLVSLLRAFRAILRKLALGR